ncbi:hypothetical protein FJZ31_20065 [Candidatus Poribacteria bacterium]|nr:hypothetical protein [Candidatus Poribacteria bacterium]
MFPLIKMTQEQIKNYRPVWGKFTGMTWIFGGSHRTFAIYITLDVNEEGQIALQDLLVACSPVFRGPGGLDEHFPLHERFPGEVTDWMIKRPYELVQVLGHFQACFITAQPNATHFALAELEKQEILKHLITGNDDLLQEREGSQKVHLKESRYFVDSEEGWSWIRAGEIFLVVGVSRDEHGFLSYAREQGIQVVVIAPERPSFLYANDWFVQGHGEEVLSELAAELSTY